MGNSTRGMVLEIKNNKAIVLTPDGRFLKQKIRGKMPEIGSEITINSATINWQAWSMIGVAALLAIIIIPLLTLQPMLTPQMAVAYVTVDINPSIELGLNKDDKVITTKALNEDGTQLLNNIDIINLPVDRAIEIITEEAIIEKHITPNKENAVVISYSNEQQNKTKHPFQKENIAQKVQEVVQRNEQKAVVEVISVSPTVRHKAQEIGLSTGKYTIMLEAWEQGLELSPETIKEKSLVVAIKEAGGNPGQVISEFHKKNLHKEISEELIIKYDEKLKSYTEKIKNKIEEMELVKDNELEEKEDDDKEQQEILVSDKDLKELMQELKKIEKELSPDTQQLIQELEKHSLDEDLPESALKIINKFINKGEQNKSNNKMAEYDVLDEQASDWQADKEKQNAHHEEKDKDKKDKNEDEERDKDEENEEDEEEKNKDKNRDKEKAKDEDTGKEKNRDKDEKEKSEGKTGNTDKEKDNKTQDIKRKFNDTGELPEHLLDILWKIKEQNKSKANAGSKKSREILEQIRELQKENDKIRADDSTDLEEDEKENNEEKKTEEKEQDNEEKSEEADEQKEND